MWKRGGEGEGERESVGEESKRMSSCSLLTTATGLIRAHYSSPRIILYMHI